MQTPRTITLKEARARLKLYVMRAGGNYIKIGVSVDPAERIKSVQTGSCIPVTLEAVAEYESARLAERAWHQRLMKYRSNLEWFKLSERSVDAVIRMVEKCATPRGSHSVFGFSKRELWKPPIMRENMPRRVANIMLRIGVTTLEQMREITPSDIMKMQGVGKVTFSEVGEFLSKKGIWKS